MSVLVVEDSDVDFEILADSIPDQFCQIGLDRVRSGELAIANLYERLQQSQKLPFFIFLDLNLIGISGFETIKILKAHDRLKRIPIIVFSTSKSAKDINRSYELGASAYFVKPMSYRDNKDLMELIFQYWSMVELDDDLGRVSAQKFQAPRQQ